MASLKSEFLSHYQEIHGTPAALAAFGAIRLLNRVGAATAPLFQSARAGSRFCAARSMPASASPPSDRFPASSETH